MLFFGDVGLTDELGYDFERLVKVSLLDHKVERLLEDPLDVFVDVLGRIVLRQPFLYILRYSRRHVLMELLLRAQLHRYPVNKPEVLVLLNVLRD